MAGYKLATYQTSDGARAGLVIDDKVYDAAKLTGEPDYASVLGILEDWRTARGALKKAAAAAGKSRVKPLPLSRTKLLAPVRWPSAIYCAGANYADHAAEMARRMNRPMDPDPHTQGLQAWLAWAVRRRSDGWSGSARTASRSASTASRAGCSPIWTRARGAR